MYVPYRQDVFSSMWLLVQAQGDPRPLAPAARGAVAELDPALPAYAMTPLAEVITESVGQRRFALLLLLVFALIALVLAVIGVYGVAAAGVSRRTSEIGVRVALGAARWNVVALVVGGGVKLTLLGVAIGTAAALTLSGLLRGMLFEVTPFDPLSYLLTAALLMVVAIVACLIPARRALGVDPLVAIRQP
jgi:putative ABC transport system permease protein